MGLCTHMCTGICTNKYFNLKTWTRLCIAIGTLKINACHEVSTPRTNPALSAEAAASPSLTFFSRALNAFVRSADSASLDALFSSSQIFTNLLSP